MNTESGSIPIDSEVSTVRARQVARDAAETVGFRITDTTRIVTAVSELARNVYRYADTGEMRWRRVTENGQSGLEFVFDDDGPGIPDVEAALAGPRATSRGSLGRGLKATSELVDSIDIESSPETGTMVRIRKWVR